MIEGSPYAKVLVNARGSIVLVNAQAEELFGYTRAEMIDASIEMLVPERFRRGHPALLVHFNEAPVARPMRSNSKSSIANSPMHRASKPSS